MTRKRKPPPPDAIRRILGEDAPESDAEVRQTWITMRRFGGILLDAMESGNLSSLLPANKQHNWPHLLEGDSGAEPGAAGSSADNVIPFPGSRRPEGEP